MTLRLLLRSHKQFKKWRRRLNIKALRNPATCENLQHHLIENLSIIPEDTNDTCTYWQAIKTAIYKACTDSIGYTTHQHQDWFDENDVEIQVLLHRKKIAFCAWENSPFCLQKYDAYHQVKAEAQRKICDIKNWWWQAKALEILHFADHHDMRRFLALMASLLYDHKMAPSFSKTM